MSERVVVEAASPRVSCMYFLMLQTRITMLRVMEFPVCAVSRTECSDSMVNGAYFSTEQRTVEDSVSGGVRMSQRMPPNTKRLEGEPYVFGVL